MRGGFTLIEVLAAAAIASLAGLALLKMNSSNLFFFHRLQHASEVSEALSLAGLHGIKQFDRSEKNLYALVENTYAIGNDDLRKYLKEIAYNYNESVVDTIVFDTDMLLAEDGEAEGNEADKREETAVQEVTPKAAVPSISFELIQVTLTGKERHGTIYQVRTQQ